MEDFTPCKANSPFHEETLLFTPLPQATSTVDKRPDLLPKPEMDTCKESPDVKNSYLSDGLSAINELREKLNSLKLNNKPDAMVSKQPEVSVNNDLNKLLKSNSQCRINENPDIQQDKSYQSETNSQASTTNSFYTPQSQPNINKSEASVGNFTDVSIPVNDLSLPPFKPGNVSLPVMSGNDLNLSNNIVNLSLPAKTNENGIESPTHLPSFVSTFPPLTLVSENVKRNMYTLNTLDEEDEERNTAREKALRIIGSIDVPDYEPSCLNFSNQSLQHSKAEVQDESGFSQLMSNSDFQKDESWCAANYGLPLKPGDESFSFLSASQVSLDFMPEDDSLFRELGSSDPPKERYSKESELTFSTPNDKTFGNLKPEETPQKSQSHIDRVGKVRESSKNVKDLFSELDLDSSVCSSIANPDLDQFLKEKLSLNGRSTPDPVNECNNSNILHVSEIARALEDIPVDATPNSLVKKVMELSDRPTTSSNSIQGYKDEEKCYYERRVVYGGIIHIDMPSDSANSQTLWSFVDLDSTLVRALIKPTTSPVKVLLFPLVRKDIVVKVCEVEFKRNNRYFERLHIIKLTVENPQLEVSSAGLDFGLVPVCGVVKIPLVMRSKNSNVLVVCPQLGQADHSLFSFEFEDDSEEEIHLPPNQHVTLNMIIKPTIENIIDETKMTNISDVLKLCLCSMLGSETLYQVNLKASIYLCRLQVQNSVLEEAIKLGEKRRVIFKNSSICPVNVKLRSSGQFHLSISSLTLQPNHLSEVVVTFMSSQTKGLVEGQMILSIVPGDLDHIIKLKGISSDETSFSSVRELSARSSSTSTFGSVNSTMTMNNSVEPEGPLQLECTAGTLSWPSLSVGVSNQSNQMIKSVYIRSKSPYKEKLIIEVDDSSNSFYILTSEREFKKSEVISIKPTESKQISAVFTPNVFGPLVAHINIKRVKCNNKDDAKQLFLYGFGGCANLRAHNIVMDLISRQCKLSLKPDFTQEFALQNNGDGVGFFSISLSKLEGMHLNVGPVKGLIGPGECRTVSLVLQPSTADYNQQLLTRDRSTDLLLSTLTIKYGDESCRLRLARLYRKNRNHLQKSSEVSNTLKTIASYFPINKSSASLKDESSSLYDLFNEGIKEMTIDVIIPRKAVEDANLELTRQFGDFNDPNQFEETEYTTFFENTQTSHMF